MKKDGGGVGKEHAAFGASIATALGADSDEYMMLWEIAAALAMRARASSRAVKLGDALLTILPTPTEDALREMHLRRAK